MIKEFADVSDKARHILRRLPSWRAFWFSRGIREYTGYHAMSLAEFCDKIKTVDKDSIEFHAHRGDFSKWIKDALNDDELARDLEEVIEKGYHGEELRNIIFDVIKRRYDELARIAINNP